MNYNVIRFSLLCIHSVAYVVHLLYILAFHTWIPCHLFVDPSSPWRIQHCGCLFVIRRLNYGLTPDIGGNGSFCEFVSIVWNWYWYFSLRDGDLIVVIASILTCTFSNGNRVCFSKILPHVWWSRPCFKKN